jgi:hypothetical protein
MILNTELGQCRKRTALHPVAIHSELSNSGSTMIKPQTPTPNTTATRQEAYSARQTEPVRGTLEWFDMIDQREIDYLESERLARLQKKAI